MYPSQDPERGMIWCRKDPGVELPTGSALILMDKKTYIVGPYIPYVSSDYICTYHST